MPKTNPKTLRISRVLRDLLLRWRHVLFALVAIVLIIFEANEHPKFLTDPDHNYFTEIGVYLTLILISGIFLEILLRSINEKNLTLSILDARHQLSLQLSAAQDWEELVSLVLQYPASTMPVSATALLMYNPDSDHYQTIHSWVAPQEEFIVPSLSIDKSICSDCTKMKSPAGLHLVNCESITTFSHGKRSCYCLHIDYGNLSVGMLHIFLPQEQSIRPDQAILLNNTAYDIAIALNTAWQRQERYAIEISNAANNERLEIARDLHDNLGQNLGYMHLKLDQILSGNPRLSFAQVKPELIRLRDLANESYELVRSTLVILHHPGDRRLSDLFKAHAELIGERAGFEVEVLEEGQPQVLLPNTVHQLFNIYKEAFFNIEKHAHASRVTVLLSWELGKLTVRIQDNGCGFVQQNFDQSNHFGLEFMEERLARLEGEFRVSSSPGQGTQLEFRVPLTVT
jgi:signal transduction histidine kinase